MRAVGAKFLEYLLKFFAPQPLFFFAPQVRKIEMTLRKIRTASVKILNSHWKILRLLREKLKYPLKIFAPLARKIWNIPWENSRWDKIELENFC